MHGPLPGDIDSTCGGTDEATWFLDPVWDHVATIDPTGLPIDDIDQLVVVAAQPGDETLGVGGTIAALADAGIPLVVVLATDAGATDNPDGDRSPERATGGRPDAWTAAVTTLAPSARRVVLGLPQGALAASLAPLRDALVTEVGPRSLVLAPWPADGQPDQETAGRIAVEVARERGARCLHHVVRWWHHNRPEGVRDLLRAQGVVVEPGLAAVHRKHAALELLASQPCPPGQAFPVGDDALARGRRPFELLLATEAPATPWAPATGGRPDTDMPEGGFEAHFDAMYDDGDDPWHWEDSWYERRRRALVMASLMRPSYHHVLEIGCATGLVTAELSARADAVTALDTSARALAVARRRGLANVTWLHAAVPDQLPAGQFDAVVVSEVAYFLTPTELLALLRGLRGRLTPTGEVVLADWRAPTTGIPLDGPLVHELVDRCLGLPRSARYEDADVLVECWSAAPSVAAAEGLA